jgi:hypothetical protein
VTPAILEATHIFLDTFTNSQSLGQACQETSKYAVKTPETWDYLEFCTLTPSLQQKTFVRSQKKGKINNLQNTFRSNITIAFTQRPIATFFQVVIAILKLLSSQISSDADEREHFCTLDFCISCL